MIIDISSSSDSVIRILIDEFILSWKTNFTIAFTKAKAIRRMIYTFSLLSANSV